MAPGLSFLRSRRAPLIGFGLMVMALAHAPVAAAPQAFTLGFASLPSAQGLAYVPSGAHSGVGEASIFSLASSVLVQNSIGQVVGTVGGSILYVGLSGLINATDPKQLRLTARCLATQGGSGAQGFAAGFSTGSVQYDISLTPTQIYALGPAGSVLVPGTYHNTAFHEYVLEFTPPNAQRIYRDGNLIYSSNSGFGVAASRVFFGDGTGAANARAEIKDLEFLQDFATDTRLTSWGRLKGLYR